MLKILTWNILAPGWFCPYQDVTYGLNYTKKDIIWKYDNFHIMRLENIINTIKKLNPDLICLQEITPNSLKIIKNKLKYKTYHSFIMNKNIANEGIATLYNPNKNIKITKTIKFLDNQNEPNIYTYVKKNSKTYLILNTHPPRGGNCFESIKYTINYNSRFKKLQKDINNYLYPFIICGDFNSSNRMTSKIEKKYKKFYWAKSTINHYNNYKNLLKKINVIDSINLIKKNQSKYYTTKKIDNIKDHEDHIFIRKNIKYKLYYGDFLKKNFNDKIIDQGEHGLLHFSQLNTKRKNWKNVYNNLTSDHRWIMINII